MIHFLCLSHRSGKLKWLMIAEYSSFMCTIHFISLLVLLSVCCIHLQEFFTIGSSISYWKHLTHSVLWWTGMAPFYEEVCRDLDWKVDHTLLAKMKSANDEHLKELEETIEDAEKNLGEMEVREANLKKSEYLCRIGDKVFFIYWITPFLGIVFVLNVLELWSLHGCCMSTLWCVISFFSL